MRNWSPLDGLTRYSDSGHCPKGLDWSKFKTKPYSPHPVHRYGSVWYFWNETWSDVIGPYDTEEEANTAFNDYCAQLDRT